jgi:hypothetical protein
VIIDKSVREVDYQLTLTQREMSILAAVAFNTAGRGDARFLYDIGGQVDEDPDLDTSDIDVSFSDFGYGPEYTGMVIDTGVEE